MSTKKEPQESFVTEKQQGADSESVLVVLS